MSNYLPLGLHGSPLVNVVQFQITISDPANKGGDMKLTPYFYPFIVNTIADTLATKTNFTVKLHTKQTEVIKLIIQSCK